MQKWSVVLTPRVLSPALWILSALGLAVCVFSVYRLAGGPAELARVAEPAPAVAAQLPSSASERLSPAVVKALAANPIFGLSPEQGAATSAGERKLSINVVGTILRGSASKAVVERSGGQKLVGIGEELDGGKVVEITRDGMVLDFAGTEVKVPITSAGRTHRSAAAPQPDASRSVAVASSGAAVPAEPQYEESPTDVDLEEFDSFAEQMRAGLAGSSASTAHDVAGQAVGLVLDRIPQDSVLGRIGIEAQDIITEINGIPVTSMAEMKSAFDQIAKGVKSGDESFIILDLIREQKKDTIILTIWS